MTVRKTIFNEFCKRLICIVINETYLIWGWCEFRQEYSNIELLRSYFADISFLVFFAIITNNIFGYICKLLCFYTLVWFYEQSLNWPDITYIVAKIRKLEFNKFATFIPLLKFYFAIPKTMIFVNNINNNIKTVEFLKTWFIKKFCAFEQANQIIQPFYLNIKPTIKIQFTNNFLCSNTRIRICTDAAEIKINVCDIICVVQWKLAKHFMFAAFI